MLLSSRGPLAVALAASSLVTATPLGLAPVSPRTPLDIGLPNLADLSKPVTAHVGLDVDLSGKTLVAGAVVGAVVPPVAGVGAAVDLAVKCKTCYTKGAIDATVSLAELVPSLSLSLTDIEAYLELDVYARAATTIAVNLYTPVGPIHLPIAGLQVAALVYVDLVLSLDAAIDVSAGIYVQLAKEALLEIDILKGELLKTDFSGLAVKTLPIEVRIGCAKLQADLRVRVQAAVQAELDVNDLIPLGIDIPEIGAGLELGVYANLVEYIGFFCDTPGCPLSKESYGLNVGVAAKLDVEIGDLIDISIAPTVSVALLALPTATHCVPGGGHTVSTLPSPGPTATSTVTGSVTSSVTGSASSSPSGSASGSATGSATGSASVTSAASVTSVATGSETSSTSAVTAAPYPSGPVETITYTITKCAASVPNCPIGYQTTQTLTSVCSTGAHSATAPITAPAVSSATSAPKPTQSDVTRVTDVTVLVPCSSVSTFNPPAGVTPYPTKPAGGNAGNYPTGSLSLPTASVSISRPGSGAYPSSSAPYPAATVSSAFPVTLPPGYTASVPAGGYPVSSSAPYPVGGQPGNGGHGNGTAPVPTGASSSYSKPSASIVYPTSKPASPSYPVSSPTPPPVTAGAGKVGAGFTGALIAAIAILL